ncbi:transcriptional regulator [Bradyrhizobium sp. CCBAU 051011]|uniref:transcriptional regulator n=1 Tax=Bradyrhizobium sp. CCBAU 051011 TaxID=858422 RepID=UPI0013738091|nr:transcriptional regulator [Bradyrhizobium sp. CCBAU 051011]QHO77615.1 transcriptional regulator [Bradyrhizobium sp. CCBAU 051011]
MSNSWKYDRAKDAIDKRLEEVKTVEIVDYKRDMSLESIPTTKAYRVDGVHMYADILNLSDILGTTAAEGERCHKRALRFLNLHQRAVRRILARCDVRRVDFHNQRLHSLVTKPYGADEEKKRVCRGVAIGKLIIDVLAETGDDDEDIPNAKVRIGIDTGVTLSVNNGRSGNREPLFLGSAANLAAKLASNWKAEGVFLTNVARKAAGLSEVDAGTEGTSPLSADEIKQCQDEAKLDVTKDEIVKEWRKDNEENPIGSFEFSRPTPPLRNLDISVLTPANSRRMEAVSTYADLDGFTKYVAKHIDKNAEDVVRCFHVIRSELDRVLSSDFGGRRIRFIGDCIHGLLMEGTAHTTDDEETISTATICAGGLRSSFNLALERLEANKIDIDGLGLAIGFEFGAMTVTRLGMQGDRVRCSVSRGVLASEDEQCRCSGTETAIGQEAYDAGSGAVQKLFGKSRKIAGLDYDSAVDALAADGDKVAKAATVAAFSVSAPAMAKAVEQPFRPYGEPA